MSILDKVQIIFVDTLGGGPAKIKIYPNDTALLTLALDIWRKSSKEVRMFFLLHELGHFAMKTSNEIIADRWAFKEYSKTGLSLEKAVKSLSTVLSISNPEHVERIKRQFYRSKHEKFLKTGDVKMYHSHIIKSNE